MVPRQIAVGVGFTEGPVVRANGEIVFVSIDQARLYRIDAGKTEVLAELPGGPNGATEAADGTMYVTQCGGRWGRNTTPDWHLDSGIQSVGRDGEVRWVTTDPIAPNDLCFGPDGLLWVTDPTRYRDGRDDGRLFRVNTETGEAELFRSLPWFPSGIGFGIEDDAVYVAKSGPEHEIVRIPIDNGRLGKTETFAKMGTFSPDGFLFDVDGNLVTTANPHGEGTGQIQIYDRSGKLVDTFSPGPDKAYSNVALGADRKLIVTACRAEAVLAVDDWPKPGLSLHPFRKARRT